MKNSDLIGSNLQQKATQHLDAANYLTTGNEYDNFGEGLHLSNI